MEFQPEPLDAILIFALLAMWGMFLTVQVARGRCPEWMVDHSVNRLLCIAIGGLAQLPFLLYYRYLWLSGYRLSTFFMP